MIDFDAWDEPADADAVWRMRMRDYNNLQLVSYKHGSDKKVPCGLCA